MKENKSPEVDGISPKILKQTVEQISTPLAHVFNMTLLESGHQERIYGSMKRLVSSSNARVLSAVTSDARFRSRIVRHWLKSLYTF